MKKILMVLAAVAATAPLWADTSADVLVWYVDTKTDNASYDGATRAFDTIKFWAVDSNGMVRDLTGQTYTGPDYLLDGGPSAGSGESPFQANSSSRLFGPRRSESGWARAWKTRGRAKRCAERGNATAGARWRSSRDRTASCESFSRRH